ncbi:MAG: IS66 family transposase [Microcoleaceae cyanobacterium]
MNEEWLEISEVKIPREDWEATPASVQAVVMRQWQNTKELKERLGKLEAQLSQLEERLKQNSKNSSRPPSRDERECGKEEKKQNQSNKSGRKRGGQAGHKGHQRYLYEEGSCQEVKNYYPQVCKSCGAELNGEDEAPYRHQVVELPPLKPQVTEHRLHQRVCRECGSKTRAKLPPQVSSSGYGEGVAALVGLLSGRHHQSHRQVKELMSEVFDVHLSTGSVNRLRREMSQAVLPAVEQAQEYLQSQRVIGSDETSFEQHNGDGSNPQNNSGWLWVVVSPLVCVFQVALSRSQATAKQLIGESFEGIVTSDRYSAYNWIPLAQRQLCWAHVKRDLVAISERSGASAEIGQALLQRQRRLFRWWHRVRDGTLTHSQFQTAVAHLRDGFTAELAQAAELDIAPREKTPLARTVRTCRKLLQFESALWTFVEHPGVEPTNNSAERALRPAVIWRRLSFGSHSQAGSEFVARMLTVVTTLKAQQRGVLDFLTQACRAARLGETVPSLLPHPD